MTFHDPSSDQERETPQVFISYSHNDTEFVRELADRIRPTARQLRKAKNQLRASVVFQSDSVTEMAHQLGYYHTIDDYTFFERFLERVDDVTAENVRETAEEIFHRTNRTVGVYLPRSGGRGK